MTKTLLQPLDPGYLPGLWVDAATQRLGDAIATAAVGQCLRVSDLPREILEPVAKRMAEASIAGCEVYFVDRAGGPEEWRVAVHKVVERRNACEGVLLALFPPDLQLAAGDSVDISTFRLVPMVDLDDALMAILVAHLPETVKPWVDRVLEFTELIGWRTSIQDRLRYTAVLATQPGSELTAVGGALYELGLVPDFGLLDAPDAMHYRLRKLNRDDVVQVVQDEGATPIERQIRLRLSDEAFRRRLSELFRLYSIDEVRAWGAAVATDARWRDLSLEQWPLASAEHTPTDFRIDIDGMKLARRAEDGVLLLESTAKIIVTWYCDPPPNEVPGLSHFRVEVLSSDRVVVWESPLIKAGGKTARRSKTIQNLSVLDSGVYFFRVIGQSEAGDPIGKHPSRDALDPENSKRSNESEDFLLVEGDEPIDDGVKPATNTQVASFAEAELLARWSEIARGRQTSQHDDERLQPKLAEWQTIMEARVEIAAAAIRYDLQRQYVVRLSQRLRRVERAILSDPDSGGRMHWSLASKDGAPEIVGIALPADFAAARRALFHEIDSATIPGLPAPVIALCNLLPLAPLIENYAESYRAWLASGDPTALCLDVIIGDLGEQGPVALVAPTHPLRLLWLLQEHQLARAWLSEATQRHQPDRGVIDVWRDNLSLQNLPALLVLGDSETYLDAGPLRGGWSAYLPPRLRDSRAVLAVLRARLGSGAAHLSEADVPPRVLADKLEAFLRQHGYVATLTLNVVNPGDASLVVDALVELESRRIKDRQPELRYDVRLFTDSSHRAGVGGAFRELIDPERSISQAADNLVGPGRSFLFPKLSWSRNDLRHFVQQPEQFPAHITLLLDAFPIDVRVARVEPAVRGSFVHGLVQSAPRRFGRHGGFAWIRQSAPYPCPEMPSAPDRSARIAALIGAIGSLQARVLAPNTNTDDFTAATALDLRPASQSLLYCAHNVSTWVLTLDPHLGLDYFDEPRRRDRPGYLLDFSPEFIASGGRQLLLTTRIDDEVAQLMAPAAAELALDASSDGAPMLLEALRSLSGRLALRVLSAPTQVRGALGMALAKLFLDAYGLLSTSVVVPLDAHQELASGGDASAGPNLRGDLLVVSADPESRQLDFLLVEAKCRTGAGIDAHLRGQICAQLQSSAQSLREAFDPNYSMPDRIDRSVQSWRLSGVLLFYLDRAERYGLVDADAATALRTFFANLDADEPYGLTVRKTGLVFRPDADTSYQVDTESDDIPIHIVGRREIDRIVLAALQRFRERIDLEVGRDFAAGVERQSPEPPSMRDDETWDDVVSAFRGLTVAEVQDSTVEDQTATEVIDTRESTESAPADLASEPGASLSDQPHEPIEAPSPELAAATVPHSPEIAFDVMLGDTKATPQYGLVGRVASEPWKRVALDLNGCNTVSVFGVQGSGKSYTVGSIVEMATRAIPGLSTLPRPLGAVVFHFHQTQDYPPEFVSMIDPNDDPEQRRALEADWQAAPMALDDLWVLTTADTVEQRRREFPRAKVAPIAFASAELTVADWRFMMGATSSDALYLKLLGEVMRKARHDLTLDAIREGIAASPLSDSQRALAETRLDFAARFIDDSQSLRDLLRPGRLIVVDLRDEFVDKDQALGLFVTLLNVFAGAGMGEERFNKLIVFDEAHKYMSGGGLIGQVVEVIREMRHKGVSVIIASQDPINVPPAVIELSSAVVLHRFNSPNWLRHIQKSLAALSDLTSPMMASLAPGEALVWANRASDPQFTRRAVKLRLRPRASRHGGSTRTAVEE